MLSKFARPARYAAVAALPFVFAAALPVTDGMTYEFVMKSTSKQTKDKEQITLRGKGTYAGDDAKLEILDAGLGAGGQESFGGKGTYFIVKDAGKEIYLVSPPDKTYMKWDIANMFAGMSKLVNAVGGLVKMQMSDITIKTEDLGAGETVQGFPTRHYRMVQNFTMSTSVLGRKSVSKSESTTDYYFSPSIRIANPFVSNSQQMAMMSQLDVFNNPDYKSQLSAATAKLPQNGVPLKTVGTQVNTDEKGKQEKITTVMEMLNFQKANVPASTFALPSDYKMIEMPDLNAGMSAKGSGNSGARKRDSAAASVKEGAKEGMEEDAKDAAKDAAADATNKLKGLFRRKKG